MKDPQVWFPSFTPKNQRVRSSLPLHKNARFIRARRFHEGRIGVVEEKPDIFVADFCYEIRKRHVGRICGIVAPLGKMKISPYVGIPELGTQARQLQSAECFFAHAKKLSFLGEIKYEHRSGTTYTKLTLHE